jgi:hypothetical protein
MDTTLLLMFVLLAVGFIISGASWKKKRAAREAAERDKPGA